MTVRWLVERLDGPVGEKLDTGVFEGDTEEEAMREAMAADDRDGRAHYRIVGPLPSGYGVLAPGREYEREA